MDIVHAAEVQTSVDERLEYFLKFLPGAALKWTEGSLFLIDEDLDAVGLVAWLVAAVILKMFNFSKAKNTSN